MRTLRVRCVEPLDELRAAMPRCTISRRVLVQRWPAVPTAPNDDRPQRQVEVGVVERR